MRNVINNCRKITLHVLAGYCGTTITVKDRQGIVKVILSMNHHRIKDRVDKVELLAKNIINELKKLETKQVEIIIKGPGIGRNIVPEIFLKEGFEILWIKDITPIPHNSCRP